MPNIYSFTHDGEEVRVSTPDALQAALESLMRQPCTSVDWEVVSTLPAGSVFFVADSKHFAECVEVQVRPALSGKVVFRNGKMVLV